VKQNRDALDYVREQTDEIRKVALQI